MQAQTAFVPTLTQGKPLVLPVELDLQTNFLAAPLADALKNLTELEAKRLGPAFDAYYRKMVAFGRSLTATAYLEGQAAAATCYIKQLRKWQLNPSQHPVAELREKDRSRQKHFPVLASEGVGLWNFIGRRALREYFVMEGKTPVFRSHPRADDFELGLSQCLSKTVTADAQKGLCDHPKVLRCVEVLASPSASGGSVFVLARSSVQSQIAALQIPHLLKPIIRDRVMGAVSFGTAVPPDEKFSLIISLGPEVLTADSKIVRLVTAGTSEDPDAKDPADAPKRPDVKLASPHWDR